MKKVNDKVPVLGSVPIIGRLFRSKGESTQKRNLLIFVTANLVSPGGSLKKHAASGANKDSINPTSPLASPASQVQRKASNR